MERGRRNGGKPKYKIDRGNRGKEGWNDTCEKE